MKTWLATIGSLLLLAGHAQAQDAKMFRVIGVPPREHGYGNFSSQVIESQKQLDDFVKQVEKQPGWNNRPDFLKALADAKVDFAAEALVLIRQSEGSGSNEVKLMTPKLDKEKLACTIVRKVAKIGTGDIADYCFAVAVDRAKVRQVDVRVSDNSTPAKLRETLVIKAK